MIRPALDAVRKTLCEAFPDYPIYVDDVPQDFSRPSFFLFLVSSPTSAMAADLRGARITWQIVYFPPVINEATGAVDHIVLYDMHDQISAVFTDAMYVVSPEGKCFNVEAFDGGPRDNEGYYTLRLDAQEWIKRLEREVVRVVDHTIIEGSNET